jgi:hypothetical protein
MALVRNEQNEPVILTLRHTDFQAHIGAVLGALGRSAFCGKESEPLM